MRSILQRIIEDNCGYPTFGISKNGTMCISVEFHSYLGMYDFITNLFLEIDNVIKREHLPEHEAATLTFNAFDGKREIFGGTWFAIYFPVEYVKDTTITRS